MKNLKKSKVIKGFRAWIRLRGMKRHKKRLESLWEQLIDNIRKLLKRDDLVFNDFYELLDSIGILFAEVTTEAIEDEFWQRCFGLATADDLVDVIKYKDKYNIEKAWQEVENRIRGGHIRKDEAEETLMRIMKEKVNELSRIRALQLFKEIGPSSEKIDELRKLPFIYSSPHLQRKIEELFKKIKKKGEKKPRKEIIQAIQKIIEEIDKLKKERS